MNTGQIQEILSKTLPSDKVNFLGVFAQDKIPLIDSSFSFPLCFVSNTHPSTKPGEHWVAFFYDSPSSLEFFDSYGLNPSVYDFQINPTRMNQMVLQSLDSDVCAHYCIFYLYHRSRGKSLTQILKSFSAHDQAWNDNSVARFVSKLCPPRSCNCIPCQCCVKRKLCKK